jgi:hypothetical protein
MERRYRTTRSYRFWRASHRDHDEALNDLLQGIWGFRSTAKVEQPTVYRAHYHGIRATVNTCHIKFTSLHDVIFLVRLMREERHQSLNHIKEKIRDSLPFIIVRTDDGEAVEEATSLGVQLWLMIRPTEGLVRAGNLLLREVVAKSFEKLAMPDAGSRTCVRLTEDFNATNLRRKSGIAIQWTSYLDEHLEINRKKRLKVSQYTSSWLRLLYQRPLSSRAPEGDGRDLRATLSNACP